MITFDNSSAFDSFVPLVTVLFVAKGADTMPKRRANGEGNIQRKDGRWEGGYTVGHDPETGKAIIKNVLGKTQAEVKEKAEKAIEKTSASTTDGLRPTRWEVGWKSGWKTTRKSSCALLRSRPQASSRITSSRRSAAFRWQISLLWTCRSSGTNTCWTAGE